MIIPVVYTHSFTTMSIGIQRIKYIGITIIDDIEKDH